MLDEDISDRVAIGLRVRGVDAVSVHELGRDNRRIPDDVQLEFAVVQGQVLVTYNRGDFQLIDARWHEEGHLHAGIFWCLEQTSLLKIAWSSSSISPLLMLGRCCDAGAA